jgi:hypothetical protein
MVSIKKNAARKRRNSLQDKSVGGESNPRLQLGRLGNSLYILYLVKNGGPFSIECIQCDRLPYI